MCDCKCIRVCVIVGVYNWGICVHVCDGVLCVLVPFVGHAGFLSCWACVCGLHRRPRGVRTYFQDSASHPEMVGKTQVSMSPAPAGPQVGPF